MSGRIEWSEVRDTPARLAPEGEYSDGFGNQNDLPALAAGESAVIEGTPEQWHAFALELLDEANELLAEERDDAEAPPTVAEVLDTAREALTLWAEGDDTAADDDAVALASALRLALLLLSPEGAV